MSAKIKYSKTEDLYKWISDLNNTIKVRINKISLNDCGFWFYDTNTGEITNKNKSFFKISGARKVFGNETLAEQPIVIQDEIGYLGIICREVDGILYYLMQAKIEPGNINKVQLSPTIQATKSNFTQKHGGLKPSYLDYFYNASDYKIIVDQIQSEQSSRFRGKRNRNIIIQVDEDIDILPNFRWMTIQQIKEFMRIDNLVNMDARTVISCLPKEYLGAADDRIFGNDDNDTYIDIYHYINNYKMFDESRLEIVPLSDLEHWHMRENEFTCDEPYSFKIVFCDIKIENREVEHWTQPLLEATGMATFGLIMCNDDGVRKFLVRAVPEIGCFDKIEIGPTVQREYIYSGEYTVVDEFFDSCVELEKNIYFDTLLSEEGGRFYYEQNRNIIIEADKDSLPELPEGYFWSDYNVLSQLLRINNCINIQLRNLLSVLEW